MKIKRCKNNINGDWQIKINKKIYTLSTVFGLTLLYLICVNVNIVYAQNDIIIDNSTLGTSYTGTWRISGGPDPYENGFLYGGDGANKVYVVHIDQTSL